MGYLLHWLQGFPADNDSKEAHGLFRATAKREYEARKAARELWAENAALSALLLCERHWNAGKPVTEPPHLS